MLAKTNQVDQKQLHSGRTLASFNLRFKGSSLVAEEKITEKREKEKPKINTFI
jgi:hypothetical protein